MYQIYTWLYEVIWGYEFVVWAIKIYLFIPFKDEQFFSLILWIVPNGKECFSERLW